MPSSRDYVLVLGMLAALPSCSERPRAENASGASGMAAPANGGGAGSAASPAGAAGNAAGAEAAPPRVPSRDIPAGGAEGERSEPKPAGAGGAPAAGSAAEGGAGAGGESAGAGGSTAVPERPSTPTTDSEGCPLDLVGFATLEGGTKGGGEVEPTTVTTQAELKACATAAEPRVCLVSGTLTFDPFEEIDVESDKTILGAGGRAEIVMGGFRLTGVHNVILRNLTIRDSFVEGQYEEGGDEGGDRDGIQLDTAERVWIDHVHFEHLGDGMIDSRKDTTLLTVSWNILENHNKAFGIGWTENVTAQLTIHHNWIHDTVQRNPSTDNVLRAHLFNNVLENVESYGNYARGGTNMVLENSVFDRVKDPHYYDTGTLIAIGNVYRNTTGRRVATGTTLAFFDPRMFYDYTLHSAEEAEPLVKRCAGPRAELGTVP